MQVSAPTNVSARASSSTSITVSWTNAQTTHDNNRVEFRNITDSGSWTVASSAVAATATSYEVTGLDPTHLYDFRVTAINAAVAQVDEVVAVADSAGSLDGLYFDLADASGPVRVWFDVDNSGTSAPATPTDGRLIEVTGIATGDSASSVATAVASAINADAQFSASAATDTVTVTHALAADRPDVSAGTSTFTVSTTTQGEDGNTAAVEAARQEWTWPNAAGYYWCAYSDPDVVSPEPTSYTHIAVVTGATPFLSIYAVATNPNNEFTQVRSADAAAFIWGESLTDAASSPPTFPS